LEAPTIGPLAGGGGGECGWLSYNGRIWRNSEAWKSEAPLYDPQAEVAA
jgi:hypothetical protein